MSVDEQKSISELFLEAFQIHGNVENSSKPTNSEENQQLVKHALQVLEIVTERVQELNLFSVNEEASEISTVNLKYLLSPGICGVLTSLVQTPREERKVLLNSAEKFLHRYLECCKDYGIGPEKDIEVALKRTSKTNNHDVAAMNAQREAKIARFKRNKELDVRLKHLKSLMSERDGDVTNVDDETVRNYWMSVIEKWIDISIENLENIAQEKDILGFWETLPDKNNPPAPAPSSSQTNGKPKNFILTRDSVQAAVFGAGYPSLPTMTVEQFYESQAAAGMLPDRGMAENSRGNENNSQEDSDSDDKEKLKKQREFDEWKDTHRRGEGNRKNMG